MGRRVSLLVGALLLAAGLANAAQVVIRVRPPAPVRVGVVGVAPGPGYVWIDGYHEYRRNRYVWVEGRWARPPHRNWAWVPAHYRPVRGGWMFVPGHWRRH